MQECADQPDQTTHVFEPFPQAAAYAADIAPQSELEIQEPAPEPIADTPVATYRPYFSFGTSDVDLAITQKLERLSQGVELRRTIQLPGENPVTDQEWKEIERGHAGIVAVGDELGVDVRDRLPKREHYHFFDDKQVFTTYFNGLVDTPQEDPQGMQGYGTGVLLLRQPNQLIQTSFTVHEGLHDVSAVVVQPDAKEDIDWNDLGPPYAYRGKLLLAETVTDMATNRVMHHNDYAGAALAYGYPNYMLTNMVHETADKHGLEPQDIEDMLIRGLLTGDQAGFDALKNALGKERVERFMQMEQTTIPRQAIKAAKSLGLPWAARAIRDAAKGNAPNSFDWLKWTTR